MYLMNVEEDNVYSFTQRFDVVYLHRTGSFIYVIIVLNISVYC